MNGKLRLRADCGLWRGVAMVGETQSHTRVHWKVGQREGGELPVPSLAPPPRQQHSAGGRVAPPW